MKFESGTWRVSFAVAYPIGAEHRGTMEVTATDADGAYAETTLQVWIKYRLCGMAIRKRSIRIVSATRLKSGKRSGE